ncbi:hypothetical protein ACIRF8_18750 [Streptomyces sp. NPDC102406]|uniref:hypothetical protein n=1 Tax=Streptomyces sp. NPDC102406 TaxID=3366171 RepID=UPI0038023B3F
MTDPRPGTTGVKEQYATQVAADLERNAKEQERIVAELEKLEAQLQALRDDQAILENMRRALDAKESAATLVKPRRASAARAGAKTGSPKRKTARTASSTPSAPPSGTDKEPSGEGRPTLVTLVQDILRQQKEPRSAAELTEALAAAHPDRTFRKPVVRTTVEGQVAKGLAQRSKQGSSVFYSAPGQAESPRPAAE